MSEPLFSLGKIVATPAVLLVITDANQSPSEFLDRHARGDWGEANHHDRVENEVAYLAQDRRIVSYYKTRLNERIWIITEADRSVTTILLPSEY